MKRTKIYGMDNALYKVYALRNGKRVGCVRVIDNTKFGAYVSAMPYLPKHDGYDYTHVRFAREDESCGVLMDKNTIKRVSNHHT